MWFAPDPTLTAYAGNYTFEERVSRKRQNAYESALPTAVATFDDWDLWHRDRYLWGSIHREVPETFTEINAQAAHAGSLSPDQYLVRVESLEHALGKTGFKIDDVSIAVQTFQTNKANPKYTPLEAADALSTICDVINSNPYSVRPRFAGFLQDVDATLTQSDWPNQIRDRFGLGHYKPNSGETIPIALMRYRVKDVASLVTGRPEAKYSVCMPTVLDSQFSQFFVPAPQELLYGRTLDLAGDEICERKIAEILHMRLEYNPGHLFMVGSITTGLDAFEAKGLAELRRNHFFCLQYDSDRDDFGATPSRWASI